MGSVSCHNHPGGNVGVLPIATDQTTVEAKKEGKPEQTILHPCSNFLKSTPTLCFCIYTYISIVYTYIYINVYRSIHISEKVS